MDINRYVLEQAISVSKLNESPEDIVKAAKIFKRFIVDSVDTLENMGTKDLMENL